MTLLTQEQQSYDYAYDKISRLTAANYTTAGKVNKFNELVDYDVMGNIVALKRTNSMSGYLHDLSYNYTNCGETGNKLWGITDAGSGNISSTYSYDANGNMLTDSQKGITLAYNQLNLPKTVTNSSESLTYTYDASGRKLRKTIGSDVRNYVDGIEYNNGEIEFIQTAEGRILPENGSFIYEYMLKDHLGNIRAAVKQDGSIIQVQDYYAFGMQLNANNQVTPSPDNAYKYNGKEWNGELSLNQYDYGARFYDPVIGRWNVVDPLAEQMNGSSPYSYGFNNPILMVDEDGMIPIIPLLLKAGASGAADMMAQAAMNYYFNPVTQGNASASFSSVNWIQVARSSAEGLIPWGTPGGRIGKAAATAIGDVTINAFSEGSDYSQEQALKDFAVGFIGDLAGGGLGDLVGKYGSKAVANGLLGLGFKTSFIRKATGGLSNRDVRSWYNDAVKGIDINLDPTEANARKVVSQRNALKKSARDLMTDRAAAADLDRSDPIRDFEYYNEKYSGDYKRIMQGGTTPNKQVNKRFGL